MTLATPRPVAHQAPLSMGFSRQEYCSRLPFPSPRESSRPRNETQVSCIAGGCLHGRQILYPLSYRKPHTYIHTYINMYMDFSGGSVAKNPPDNARDTGEAGLIPGLGRSPGGGNEPTPVFLFGKSHGQRRLVGYSSWAHKELDTT